MSAPAFDPEDWRPEDNGVATDPWTMETMNERWIQFYTDRMNWQIAQALEKAANEEG